MAVYSIAALVIGGLTAAAGIVLAVYYRRNMREVYEHLLLELDRALSGEQQDVSYDESLDAAVRERLNRLVKISSMKTDEAEGERDTVKALISDISHQVRTPLSNIMLYTDLLKEQNLEKPALQLVEKVQKNSSKLDFFMKELVKTSYAEQEIIAVSPQLVEVEELVETVCQNIELTALKKRIRMKQEILTGKCFADKKWTIEAVGNVLENAVKYSPEGSELSVSTIIYEAFICIRITDQGVGIPEEEQGKVFERFYRGKQVKQEPGFGIGLYLTREVFSKQGGYVKIKSAPQKGTSVELYLSRFAI